MSTMGERIRKAREDRALFQSQLAELIGVKSAGVISNWEKDLNKPDAEKIVRLCEVLNISASYLLDYHGGTTLTPFELTHINKYRRLNDGGKAKLDEQLDDMLKLEKYTQPEKVAYPVAAREGDGNPLIATTETPRLMREHPEVFIDNDDDI